MAGLLLLAAYSTKDLSDSHLKVVSLVDSEDGDGKFTEEAMEAIGHTTLEMHWAMKRERSLQAIRCKFKMIFFGT